MTDRTPEQLDTPVARCEDVFRRWGGGWHQSSRCRAIRIGSSDSDVPVQPQNTAGNFLHRSYIIDMRDGTPPRKLMRRREVSGGLRFITFSCHRRLPLLRHASICDLFVRRMQQARQRDGLAVYAWVIMPEHVHVLCRPPEIRPLGPILSGG